MPQADIFVHPQPQEQQSLSDVFIFKCFPKPLLVSRKHLSFHVNAVLNQTAAQEPIFV